MSNRRRTAKGGKTGNRTKAAKRKDASWKRSLAWGGGVTTALAAAAAAAFGTGLGQSLFSVAHNTVDRPTAATTGKPVLISLAKPESSMAEGNGDTHVFRAPLDLTAAEVATLNSFNFTAPPYQAWLASRGAVDAGATSIQLVVQGNRNYPVRIVGLQPVVSCSAPLDGTLLYSPSAGSNNSTSMLIDLDKPFTPPAYIQYSGSGNYQQAGKDYFGHFTVSLKKDEQFVFQIVASTKTHFCSFSLSMTVLDGQKTTTETITNNGHPFAATAVYTKLVDGLPDTDFSRYRELYVGGVGAPRDTPANAFGDTDWIPEDPATFTG